LARFDFLRHEIRDATRAAEMPAPDEDEQFFIAMFAESFGHASGGEFFLSLVNLAGRRLWRRGGTFQRTPQRQKPRGASLRFAQQGAAIFPFAGGAGKREAREEAIG